MAGAPAGLMKACIFYRQPRDFLLAGRTLRSLRAAGLQEVQELGWLTPEKMALARQAAGVWFLRAGSWLARPGAWQAPLPSATGRGLCAVGLPLAPGGQGLAASVWARLHRQTGGDFSRLTTTAEERAELTSIYWDSRALATLNAEDTLEAWLAASFAQGRAVHFPPLDACLDHRLRVLQIIPALHRGGAEQITIQLCRDLNRLGTPTAVALLGRPGRQTLPPPPQVLDLSAIPRRQDRHQRLARCVAASGIDLLHTHLLTGADMRAVAASGAPQVVTVHNTRAGWPEGLDQVGRQDVALCVGCAQAVAREWDARRIPIRVVWNGIDPSRCAPAPEAIARGLALRRGWGFQPEEWVLLALANFRPQKRLHLLPEILQATRDLLAGDPRAECVRLVIAGEALTGHPEAQALVQSIKAGFRRLGLESSVRWLGSVSDIAALLAAVDALVSPSAHEGLSLAHLEAIAAGKWVVAAGVGGTPEVAAKCPRLLCVPAAAPPAAYAEILVEWIARPPANPPRIPATESGARGEVELDSLSPPPSPTPPAPPPPSQPASPPATSLPADFTHTAMARRYRWLYERTLAAVQRRPGKGVWLITNNFSVGGAQSSARRLLLGLKKLGVPVRAMVVQEDPSHPTPGCQALAQAGVAVLTVPAASSTDPLAGIQPALVAIDADPAQAVFFWNLIPWIKILLADALWDTPIFDVSPGEMYYASLDKYWAHPLPGVPCLSAPDYGQRLAGVVVKYQAEAAQAAATLQAPVQVIPNGLPWEEYPEKPPSSATGIFRWGTAARINPQKRLEELLQAFRLAVPHLPPCELLIAGGVEPGDEDYAQQLRALARDLPVVWMGEVDIRPFYSRLDAFVMVSHPAGCPNASLEALATGLPVIATDVGGASEQVLDQVTGLLVPPDRPYLIANAMVKLALDPALQQTLGRNARGHIKSHFSLEKMVADYLKLVPTQRE